MRRCASVALAALITLFPICAARSQTPTAQSGTVSGRLRIALDVEPDTLIPMFSTTFLLSHFNSLIFDPLTTIDDRGEMVPRLAREVPTVANGGISRDGRTITFHLRRDVRWQDGAPFTSRDVAFTAGLLNDPHQPLLHNDAVARVETPDSWTVRFKEPRRDATILLQLFNGTDSGGFVLPAHLLQHEPDLRASAFNSAPVGTGPFRLANWRRGVGIELAANDDYYLQKPGLRRISILLLPSAQAEANALLRHDVDWIVSATPQTLGGRLPDGVRMTHVRSYSWIALAFNLRRTLSGDLCVRRAIASAIDRDALAEKAMLGAALPASGDIPSFSWAFDPVQRAPADAVRSRTLLTRCGWVAGPDGVAHSAAGRLSLVLTTIPFLAGVAVQIQQMLLQAGIEVELKQFPLNLYYATSESGGIIRSGKFDLALVGSYGPPDPDNRSAFACTQPGGTSTNIPGYCNVEMDRLLRESVATFDRTERKRAYRAIERLAAQDLPYLFLFWPDRMTLISEGVRGFMPGPGPYTWNAAEWQT